MYASRFENAPYIATFVACGIRRMSMHPSEKQPGLRPVGAFLVVLFMCGSPAGADDAKQAASQPDTTTQPERSALETIRDEAIAVAPLVQTDLARDFLKATARLPNIRPRTV